MTMANPMDPSTFGIGAMEKNAYRGPIAGMYINGGMSTPLIPSSNRDAAIRLYSGFDPAFVPYGSLVEAECMRKQSYDQVTGASVVSRSPAEVVFKGAGHSHFSYERDNGWHVTTEVPGLRQGQRIAIHDSIFD